MSRGVNTFGMGNRLMKKYWYLLEGSELMTEKKFITQSGDITKIPTMIDFLCGCQYIANSKSASTVHLLYLALIFNSLIIYKTITFNSRAFQKLKAKGNLMSYKGLRPSTEQIQ